MQLELSASDSHTGLTANERNVLEAAAAGSQIDSSQLPEEYADFPAFTPANDEMEIDPDDDVVSHE